VKVQLKRLDWPPLIESHHSLPGWFLFRDVVLTLLAWAVLAYLLLDAIAVGVDYLQSPRLGLDTTKLPDMGLVWQRLRPYAEIIAVFLLWLLICAAILRRNASWFRLKRAPAVLPLAQHAALLGLDASAVAHWQQQRIQVVYFTEDGQISSATEDAKT
jgi:poly-beta-1,6-N-acetyl-D-glucosamine biosynthesis protein PgaD